MKKNLMLAALMMVASTTALAGDLINRDSKKYDLRIGCGGGTTVTSIAGNTTQSGAVKSGCKIDMGGVKHEVKGDGHVTIKDGKISQ